MVMSSQAKYKEQRRLFNTFNEVKETFTDHKTISVHLYSQDQKPCDRDPERRHARRSQN